MKVIDIDGYIGGLESDAEHIKSNMPKSGDVTIKINSGGGSVFEGFEMYNVIKDYTGGEVFVEIGALSASAASFLAMATPVKNIKVHKNSTFMIHMVSTLAVGNAKELEKEAQIMAQLDNLLVDIYAENNEVLGYDEIKEALEEETYYIGGQAIIDAGFAGSLIDSNEGGKASKKDAQAQIKEMLNRFKDEQVKSNFVNSATKYLDKKTKKNFKQNTKSKTTKQENKMDLNKLKAEHPGVYAKALADGVQSEKDRVNTWMKFVDSSPDEVAKGIVSGKAITQAEIIDLMEAKVTKKLNGEGLENLKNESPEPVTTKAPEKTEPKVEDEEGEKENSNPELEKFLAQQAERYGLKRDGK